MTPDIDVFEEFLATGMCPPKNCHAESSNHIGIKLVRLVNFSVRIIYIIALQNFPRHDIEILGEKFRSIAIASTELILAFLSHNRFVVNANRSPFLAIEIIPSHYQLPVAIEFIK